MADNPPLMPPLPEFYQIPVGLLQKWVALPVEKPIAASLTRQDIDHLLFALLRGGEAQSQLEQTLVNWSGGKIDEANRSLAEFRRLNIESHNHTKQFFTAVMISAVTAK